MRLVEDSSLAELQGEEGAELKMEMAADVAADWDMVIAMGQLRDRRCSWAANRNVRICLARVG